MTIELKRCPFCGSEAAEPDGNNHTWCSETSCGSDSYLSVEAWNRRPEPGKPESGVLAEAVKASYTAGFKASSQGWNGEHGCETETDPDFLKGRDDYVRSLRSYPERKNI
jgi:hypothetical protein